MQTSSARKFLRMPRFDSSTGKRRGLFFGWRALAAGLSIALLAGSGIAVAAVASSAEAHNRKITVTCTGITIHGDQYNTNNGQNTNTVTVTMGGVQQSDANGGVSPISFETGYDGFFAFPDPSVSTSYTAKIEGWDGYASEDNGNSPVCAKPSLVSIDVPACTAPGLLLDLTANLGDLDASHSYSISLATDGAGTNVGPTDLGAGFSAPTYSYKFTNVIPGHDYTVTVVDNTTHLTGSATQTWVGCPEDAGIDVAPCVCTVPDNGGNASFMVQLSGLSYGRSYQVDLIDATGAGTTVLQSQTFVADLSGAASIDFPVAGGGTYKAVVTDLTPGSNITKTSKAIHFLPCPNMPAVPIVDPGECTTTNGVPDSSLTFSASALVPDRDYEVTVVDGTGATVYDSLPFTAHSSAWPVVVNGPQSVTIQVPPGKYTVTVTDIALNAFFNSATVEIIACPLLPELAFTPSQCTVPGGTSAVGVTITNFVASRVYNIGVTTLPGGAVAVPVAPFTAPAAGPWVLPPFTGLPANAQYLISVTDSVVPAVTASGNVSLKPCPGTPSITVDATCNVLGASTINVSLAKLENGETYTVTVTNASTGKVVGTTTTPGTTPTVTLKIGNIPNGNQYTVDVANATNTLTGSASFYLKNCDLPTLAFTGANPVGPAVAGIGFLQFGLMLLALALVVKRRRRA